MSSISHPADSGGSSQSILSRRQSEMGSQYVVESGIFMSSFTATIFIAALVTTGILILTLLVALSVMLKSCQNNSSGILEHIKKSDHQHDYCSLYIFHAELNNLELDEFPSECKIYAHHHSKSHYLKDLNTSIWFVEDYLGRLLRDDDGLDIILLDADDIVSLIGNFSGIIYIDRNEQFEDIKHEAHHLLVRLHMQLLANGWPLFLFTRNSSKHRQTMESTLISSGYVGWSTLLMRSDDEIEMEDWEYLSSRRLQLHKQGFRIVGLISSNLDAFRGPCLGRRSFKLANIQYYELENGHST